MPPIMPRSVRSRRARRPTRSISRKATMVETKFETATKMANAAGCPSPVWCMILAALSKRAIDKRSPFEAFHAQDSVLIHERVKSRGLDVSSQLVQK